MRAVGVGELLWDLLPGGPRLGGAPFNAIAHLRRLGFRSTYVSAVGNDELGGRARQEVRRLGVATGRVQVVNVPTGIVRVQLDGDGVPRYEIVSPAAYEALRPPRTPGAWRPAFDILVFGTLAQRFAGVLATTHRLVAARPQAVRLYDVNLRQGCWDAGLVRQLLPLATIVKVNDDEREVLAGALSLPPEAPAFTRALAAAHRLRAVCVTRGEAGAALLLDGQYLEVPAVPASVVDTVGAGDAFTAGLAAGVARGWAPARTLDLATRLAALVASRAGAIPDWSPRELRRMAVDPATTEPPSHAAGPGDGRG